LAWLFLTAALSPSRGKNIIHDWEYRSHIGYMPQIGRYPDNMTIAQVLDMMKDIRKQRNVDETLIHALGLSDILKKRMRTLSGGTRQKVSASLAFLFNPDVLILDEPTAGLIRFFRNFERKNYH
jgi:Cu-processing system ATP-binding protein